MKKQNKLSTTIVFVLVLALLLPQVHAQISYSCEQLAVLPFTDQITEQYIIDEAIKCERAITNDQFKLASKEKQEKYVLSYNADFLYIEQNSVFIRTILKNDMQINDSTKDVVKRFLTTNEDYLFKEDETNKTVKNVFEKVANQSISTINEINIDGQNNIAYLRYFNTTSYFTYVNSNFDYYDNDTKIFISNGQKSSLFTTEDIKYFESQGFSEFFMKSDGRINANKYFGEEICSDCDYKISPDGKTIQVESGNLKFKDRIFSSNKPYIVNVEDNNHLKAIGDVAGVNPETSEIMFRSNGEITILANDHYLIGKNTEYTQYENNEPKFNINTEKETNYFSTNQPAIETLSCTESTDPEGKVCYSYDGGTPAYVNPCDNVKGSCIHFNPAYNELSPVKLVNNKLILNDDSSFVQNLKVEQMDKNSEFIYNNKGGTVTFTSDNVNEHYTDEVNHGEFPTYTADVKINGESHTMMSDSSTVSMCTTCTGVGGFKNASMFLPETTNINGVYVITINIKGAHDNGDGTISYFDGLHVETRVKASTENTYVSDSTTKCFSGKNDCEARVEKIGNSNVNLGSETIPKGYEVLIVTGHHYSYQAHSLDHPSDSIWSDPYTRIENGKTISVPKKSFSMLTWEEDPPETWNDWPSSDYVQVVMFSSCNTVKNPEGEKRFREMNPGRIGRYSESFIKTLNKKYPNLRLVIGYDSVAPGIDPIYDNPLTKGNPASAKDMAYVNKLLNQPGGTGLTDFSVLENAGFMAFGQKALGMYKVDLELLNNPPDNYGGDFTRLIAYYYKDGLGYWHYRSNYYTKQEEYSGYTVWVKGVKDVKLDIPSKEQAELNNFYNNPQPNFFRKFN